MDKLQAARIQVLTCTNCGLSCNCTSPVPVHIQAGNEEPYSPRYLVIGEAPGKIEDIKGEPFSGPAGLFLRKALRHNGLRPTDGAYMNAVSCFPKETGTPTQAEVTLCKHNLFAQMEAIETPYVLVVGKVALTALLPGCTLDTAMGGPVDAHGKVLFPVYHPSYILRTNSREVRIMWDRHLATFGQMVNGLPITRNSLQIINCLYCMGHRLPDSPVCIRHETQFEKDCRRPKFKYTPAEQLTLEIT